MRWSTTTLIAAAAVWIAASPAALSPREGGSRVAGVVRDVRGPVPNALVRVQATQLHTRTDSDGRFRLDGLPPGRAVTLTASALGYYNGGPVSARPGVTGVAIQLVRHVAEDNAGYEWVGARRAGAKTNCEECHSESDSASSLLPFDEWARDAHGTSAQNPRFLSMYNGTDLTGQHRSPVTRYSIHPDYGRAPLPPNPDQPDYGPGYMLDAPGNAGNCAACHAPAAAIAAPYSTDPNFVSGVGREGVTCDLCHKLWAVRLDSTTRVPPVNMPGVLSMGFRRPPAGHQLFIGPFDDAVGENTYSPLQNKSEFCAPCHFGQFWGVSVYNSFGEWQRSSYNDPVNGRTCQDCHMPRRGATRIARADKKGLQRAPGTIFSHLMPGAADVELLRRTVRLEVTAQRRQDRVEVEVRVTNENAGHHVPTDHPARNMLLLVDASDSGRQPLESVGTQVLPEWAGVGSAADDYAGRPGKAYAKVLEERWTGISPSAAYWRPTVVREDTRLPAKATDVTRYEFIAPASGEDVTITATVVFRRAFKSLAVRKGWQTADIKMATSSVVVRQAPR